MSLNDAMMLLVFIAMGAWVYGMFWFFGPGADERWCNHSLRHVCDVCRSLHAGR